ncbi:MAG TPA: hypothetical protein QF720_07650 [Nitrospinota bacterium]|nr:hypothetical protein [Nitrospinota bacterium]|tara:strand:- start:11208 stop:11918 length:711 start_codon:yes stop_codon:yes gene_type:complete
MSRILTIFLFIALNSCATGWQYTKVPLDSIKFEKLENLDSVKAVGNLRMEGTFGKFSGTILLATKGSMFRLEIFHKIGKVVLAVVGNSKKIVAINFNDGQKKIYLDKKIPLFGSISIPVELIQSLVTGKVPPLGTIKRAWKQNEMIIVQVENPNIKLIFNKSLKNIQFFDKYSDKVEILLNPQFVGNVGEHVRSVEIRFKSGKAWIDWFRVATSQLLPDDYFEYDKMFEMDSVLAN